MSSVEHPDWRRLVDTYRLARAVWPFLGRGQAERGYCDRFVDVNLYPRASAPLTEAVRAAAFAAAGPQPA